MATLSVNSYGRHRNTPATCGLGNVRRTVLFASRGTLRIETEDGGSQFFFISEGEIVLVRQVKRDPVRLGDLLVKAGNINTQQLDEGILGFLPFGSPACDLKSHTVGEKP